MDLLNELDQRVILADGAMGTQLLAQGFGLQDCLEELCVREPEVVARIHAEYLDAGARLIRTNSFGANAARLATFGFERRVSEFNWSAAQIAKAAVRNHGAIVAGSVGPLGIGGERRGEWKTLFEDQMGALLDGGAQVIVLETFSSIEELLIAIEVKHSLHHCPVAANVVCDAAGWMRDGTSLAEAWSRLRAADVDIVGINCADEPRTLPAIFAGTADEGPRAAFPNAGEPVSVLSPAEFASIATALVECGVRLIGGCCGTTPSHIRTLAEALAAR